VSRHVYAELLLLPPFGPYYVAYVPAGPRKTRANDDCPDIEM